MAAINTTQTAFAANEQITSSKLNNILLQSKIDAGAVTTDGTLEVVSGQLQVKLLKAANYPNGGITAGAIADATITPAKLSAGGPSWSSSSSTFGSGLTGSYTINITPSRTGDGSTTVNFGSQTSVSTSATIARASGVDGALDFTQTGAGTMNFTSPSGFKFATAPMPNPSGTAPIYGARAFAKINPYISNSRSAAFKSGTYSAAVGTVVTVTIASHGLKAFDKIRLVFTKTAGTGTVPSSTTTFDVVSLIDSNNFTVAFTSAATSLGTVIAEFIQIAYGKNISSASYKTSSGTFYVLNFETPMPNVNYSTIGMGHLYPSGFSGYIMEDTSGETQLNTIYNAFVISSDNLRFANVTIFA